jgi:ribonucleotide reductase alpha subunit
METLSKNECLDCQKLYVVYKTIMFESTNKTNIETDECVTITQVTKQETIKEERRCKTEKLARWYFNNLKSNVTLNFKSYTSFSNNFIVNQYLELCEITIDKDNNILDKTKLDEYTNHEQIIKL